jgi:capsular polysaccharide biosynthesis protein/Mrp family chromosome partitioning ATPase
LVEVVDLSDRSAYNAFLASEQLTQTEVDLATSDPILAEVASHYRGLTPDQLAQMVSGQTRLNTQLFEIDVRDTRAERAASIANNIVAALATRQALPFAQGQVQIKLLTVQPATRAKAPVQPNSRLDAAIGVVAGLLLGIVIAILRGPVDRRLHSPEAIGRLLDLPVLGIVRYPASVRALRRMRPTGQDDLSTQNGRLRANLEFLGVEAPVRSVLVTSIRRLDVKTLVSASLGGMMAAADKTTLVVDANLRAPRLRTLFELDEDQMGLSDALLALNALPDANPVAQVSATRSRSPVHRAGASITDQALTPYIHDSGVSNLWIMASGPLPPNPAGILRSHAMQRLLDLAGTIFDVIIIDGPELSGQEDADVLASKVDAVLLTVDVDGATQGSLEQAKSRLVQAGSHTLACVITEKERRFRRAD